MSYFNTIQKESWNTNLETNGEVTGHSVDTKKHKMKGGSTWIEKLQDTLKKTYYF